MLENGACVPQRRGRVHAEDKGLDALLDLFLGQVVHLDEGRQIGVEGGKGLRAGPLVLHDAQKVDHLIAQGAQVAGRGGIDFSGDAQALLNQLLQAPAGAVAGEHGQVVDVDVAAAVGLGDLLVIDLAEPVVGRNGAGVGQNQAAHGIRHGGVFLDPPVADMKIVVDEFLVVQHGGVQIPDLFPLLAVEDVGLGHVVIAGPAQHALHAVLDVLHGDLAVADLVLVVCRDLQGKQIDDIRVVLLSGGLEGLGDGGADLGDVERGDLPIPLDDLIHETPAFSIKNRMRPIPIRVQTNGRPRALYLPFYHFLWWCQLGEPLYLG